MTEAFIILAGFLGAVIGLLIGSSIGNKPKESVVIEVVKDNYKIRFEHPAPRLSSFDLYRNHLDSLYWHTSEMLVAMEKGKQTEP